MRQHVTREDLERCAPALDVSPEDLAHLHAQADAAVDAYLAFAFGSINVGGKHMSDITNGHIVYESARARELLKEAVAVELEHGREVSRW